MFDVPHFKRVLNEYCPSLTIVDSDHDIPGYQYAYVPDVFHPRDLYTRITGKWNSLPEMENIHLERFRKDFDKVMEDPGVDIYHEGESMQLYSKSLH